MISFPICTSHFSCYHFVAAQSFPIST